MLLSEPVEAFLKVVADNWDKLNKTTRSFDKLCTKLYPLYHDETNEVTPSKTEDTFKTSMSNLVELHKRTGGIVKLKKHRFTEFHTNYSVLEKADLDFSQDPHRIFINASTKNVIALGRILVKLEHFQFLSTV
jgi:hypothetical protein